MNTYTKRSLLFAFVVGHLALLPWHTEAKVTLPAFFSNNMVLQQKDNAPLWGSTDSKKEVKIRTSWNGKSYIAKPDSKGNWKIAVSTPSYGGPYSITFDDGETLTLSNILIGEVWVCSGQSNMEMPLAGWGKINNYEKEIQSATFPEIRLLQVQKATSTAPLSDVKIDGGSWQLCSPNTVENFSSVAYFFARNIYESKHIPIGLIHTSWGGTIAEAWTSGPSLKKMSDFASAVQKMENDRNGDGSEEVKYQAALKVWTAALNAKDQGYEGGKAIWAAAGQNISDWQTMTLPATWESAGLGEFDGIVWFRKTFTVPAAWAGKDLTLSLGPIDDNDYTFFNGIEIGKTEGWDKPRTYTVPGNLVKEGENSVTVRVYDGSGNGGIYGEAKKVFVKNASGEKVELAGEWRFKKGASLTDLPSMPVANTGPNRPTVLYNAMINPIVPYAIRGAIWYQGESNASRAYQYRELFPLMISDWRKSWNRGDFPFYFVQLANFMKANDQPVESEWAELREAQKMTLSLPNTGMAVTIDIGEEKDIHPKNKQEVGRRLALIARANVYGEKIAYSGPIYESNKIENNTVRLSFKRTDKGLSIKGGNELKGFAIAGSDQKFYWAQAKIVGNTVVVSSPQVPNPVAVRYNWANNPSGNLYNVAGLPASPFRTDDWKGITAGKK
ncbi:sialate O-acetylesterase [Arcticibacter tournemirensis]|uniref:9-O-acetylesterase n=1 Tax=Arcticibacter tournemirensis TaxID=699437 RepID=A0A4Q0M8Z6_9SPHI|nr:sialate O-acetylesterase [Arcticibacter tournemirensis]RXF69658.1 9-O-acetylesterase [Arcticibacter tournemirensis]